MSEFIDFIRELLDRWGPISTRRMFGGHGLYFEGVMFAIVMNNRLFLKVDAHNRADFENLGLKPFLYTMKGKEVALSYWAAPDAIFDEPTQAVRWAMSAWDAAMRNQATQAQIHQKAQARRRKNSRLIGPAPPY